MPLAHWSVGQANTATEREATESEAFGYAAGLLTWALAGGVFVAVKLGVGELPPWTFCCWRAALAALVLTPFVWPYRQEIVEFLRKRGIEAFVIGAIGLGLTQGTMFTALSYTSAVNVGIIFATAPIITMLLSHFVIHERLNAWQFLGSAIAFSGIVVVTVHGSLAKLLGIQLGIGDLLVVMASIMFACYSVLLKRAKFTLKRLPLLVILLSAGAVADAPFFLWELWQGEHENLGFLGYMTLLYTVIPGGALLYLCYNWSIDILGPSRAGALVYTQMIFTALFAWLVLSETIEWYHYLGAGLIITGVALVTWLGPKPSAASK
ncbi:MAG: DMT family transporter [Methyloceanibacter sp.]|nr:DMT family transporter [Methyloceanibacter sp.]